MQTTNLAPGTRCGSHRWQLGAAYLARVHVAKAGAEAAYQPVSQPDWLLAGCWMREQATSVVAAAAANAVAVGALREGHFARSGDGDGNGIALDGKSI